MKKRSCALGLGLALLLSLCACAGGEKAEDDGRVRVVALIFPEYDLAREVAGELANITMLLAPGEETHTFDPSPADLITIQSADVFIYGGGESDAWVDDVLSSVDTEKMQIVKLMDCCDVLEEEHGEGMQTEKEHGEHEHESETEYDEHVWTSPVNAMKIVAAIADALCAADAENAESYRANAAAYTEKLSALDAELRAVADSSARKTLVFGDRFPLLYFVREYGLDYYAAFPGCASNTEPSAETVAFLIDKVRGEGIPIVFKIELSSGQTAELIAEESGARVETFYSCHTVSRDDFKNGETYLSLMGRNVELLREALN